MKSNIPRGLSLPAPVTSVREAGGQHGYQHLIAELADGRRLFVKAMSDPDHEQRQAFAAEANGLRWLRAADGGAPVPEVVAVADDLLAIEYLPPGRPTPEAAEDFGAALARTHRAGAEHFGGFRGVVPPGQHSGGFRPGGMGGGSPAMREGRVPPGQHSGALWPGYIASLPMDNTPSSGQSWGEWWQERRGVPYIRRARDENLLSAADLRLVETAVGRAVDLGGPAEPPSRIHGDLWSGNVLWSGGRAWLIDPAAHGGHRESDLAMLDLFGAPHLERILAAYDAEFPLADGWRARIPLHQIYPLLVHVCLFGGGYAGQLSAAARAALTA